MGQRPILDGFWQARKLPKTSPASLCYLCTAEMVLQEQHLLICFLAWQSQQALCHDLHISRAAINILQGVDLLQDAGTLGKVCVHIGSRHIGEAAQLRHDFCQLQQG